MQHAASPQVHKASIFVHQTYAKPSAPLTLSPAHHITQKHRPTAAHVPSFIAAHSPLLCSALLCVTTHFFCSCACSRCLCDKCSSGAAAREEQRLCQHTRSVTRGRETRFLPNALLLSWLRRASCVTNPFPLLVPSTPRSPPTCAPSSCFCLPQQHYHLCSLCCDPTVRRS